MSTSVIIRDSVTLDERLEKHLRSLVTPVILVGRVVTCPAARPFRFHVDTTIVADRFEGNNGTIVGREPDDASQGVGADGNEIVICCRVLASPITIDVSGGKGGKGATGAVGRTGSAGPVIDWNQSPAASLETLLESARGGRGGQGSDGETGGGGGNGGETYVYFVDCPPGVSEVVKLLDSPGQGGDGGDGGPGGAGGAGGQVVGTTPVGHSITIPFERAAAPGDTGPMGPAGPQGAAGGWGGNAVVRQSNTEFFERVGENGVTARWAAYRYRVAEYVFRQGPATDGGRSEWAFGELTAARDMALDHPIAYVADELITRLLNNQTVLGPARLKDLIPDFPLYESVFVNYHSLIDSAYRQALQLMLRVADKHEAMRVLDEHSLQLEGQRAAVQIDLVAKKFAAERADADEKFVDARLVQAQHDLEAKKAEIENATVDVPGAIISTVGIICGLIAALPTGGTSLLAVIPTCVALYGAVKSADLGKLLAESRLPADAEKPLTKKIKDEAQGLKGAVEAIQGAQKAVIDLQRIRNEIWQAKVDNEGYRQLMLKQVDLAHEQLLAGLTSAQSGAEIEAVERRLLNVESELQTARSHKADLQVDAVELATVAMTLVRTAQGQIDVLARNAFYAARALELYTHRDMSSSIRFDYGYVHPDLEADAEEGLIGYEDLVSAYLLSWARYPDLVRYRSDYVNYFLDGALTREVARIEIADSRMVAFRGGKELTFSLGFSDFPTKCFEVKAIGARVSLVGATAVSGTVTASLENSGVCQVRVRSGHLREYELPPRSMSLLATFGVLQADGGPVLPRPAVGFWGRGAVSSWRLSIDADEVASSGIDLTGLQRVQIWLEYEAIRMTVWRRIWRRLWRPT